MIFTSIGSPTGLPSLSLTTTVPSCDAVPSGTDTLISPVSGSTVTVASLIGLPSLSRTSPVMPSVGSLTLSSKAFSEPSATTSSVAEPSVIDGAGVSVGASVALKAPPLVRSPFGDSATRVYSVPSSSLSLPDLNSPFSIAAASSSDATAIASASS